MPRVNIPLAGQDYEHTSNPQSSQVSQNWYLEANPGVRNSFSMRPLPGLTERVILESVDRGLHRFNEELFAVNGSSLYEIAFDGTFVNHGEIAGTGRCIMADDGEKLIIVTGQTPYIYTVSGGLQLIEDPDLVNPTCVAYLNSQFIFDNNAPESNRGEFVTSELLTQDFNVNGLDFATAESHPDDITRIITVGNVVWMMGARSVEQWYNSGVGRPPFDRLQSGTLNYGLMGRHAVCYTGSVVYWLDEKRRVLRSTGGQPEIISTPALGQALNKYAVLDDCICQWWTQESQTFVLFTFPTENRSWVFHEPTGTWSRWTYSTAGDRTRANSIINAEGGNFAADHSNGAIYELDPCAVTDAGEVIQRRRVTPTMHGGLYGQPGRKIYFDTVEFLVSVDPCFTQLSERIEPSVTTTLAGVCGDTSQLTRGALLSPVQGRSDRSASFLKAELDTLGKPLSDTKAVSFTVGFRLETEPPFFGGADNYANLITVNTSGGTGYASGVRFEVFVDTDGYVNVVGKNRANVTILDCQITNSGGSFADDEPHLVAFACDLAAGREVWVDGVDADAFVTWNTYTDDELLLQGDADTSQFGLFRRATDVDGLFFPVGPTHTVYEDGRSVFFVTFDDSCTLIPAGVWDANGYVTDPQGDFTGWYTSQPFHAFAGGWWVNGGRLGTDLVSAGGQQVASMVTSGSSTDTKIETWPDSANVNFGVGGDEAVLLEVPTSFDPAPVQNTQIVAPYYNQEGDFFVLSDFATQAFEDVFGVPVSGANKKQVLDTPAALLFNTNESGNRVRILDEGDYANDVKVWVTDTEGNVQTSSNTQLTLPTGANRYLIVASDTGQAHLRKFKQQPSVPSPNNPARRQQFAAFFGEEQSLSGTQYIAFGPTGPKIFSAPAFSIPVYKKDGRRISVAMATTTGSSPANPLTAFATEPGAFSGSTVIDTGGAGGGNNILLDNDTDPGWYWFNIRILDYFAGVPLVLYYDERDNP